MRVNRQARVKIYHSKAKGRSLECLDCEKPIVIDPFNGKTPGSKGYCIGLNVCLRRASGIPTYQPIAIPEGSDDRR